MKKKGGGVQLRVHKLPLCEKCGIAFGKKELLHAHLCTHKERICPDRNNRTERKRQVNRVLQATENAKVLEELTPDDIKKQLQSAIKSFRRVTRGESSVGQSDEMTAESCAPIVGARASDLRDELQEHGMCPNGGRIQTPGGSLGILLVPMHVQKKKKKKKSKMGLFSDLRRRRRL